MIEGSSEKEKHRDHQYDRQHRETNEARGIGGLTVEQLP
jgi:hypothetical protein